MDKDEALKLALERCCNHDSDCAVHSMPAYPNEPCDCSLAALAQPEQEPVDFASLLREAGEFVQSKPTWKRFIDGTPLANDIAVWMSVFAQDVARRTSPPQRTWVGLTDEDITEIDQGLYPTWKDEVQAIEAKLKEKNT